jgi:DNA invertase Pin-like site-specific DNA recombinase
VSVTPPSNTTLSTGRLTLNNLTSFAQPKREFIGERIRDQLTARHRKGKWTWSRPVLGYAIHGSTRGTPFRSWRYFEIVS